METLVWENSILIRSLGYISFRVLWNSLPCLNPGHVKRALVFTLVKSIFENIEPQP